jgi:hypothetical protein
MDLRSDQVIDLLAEGEASSVAKWLPTHPEIQ